MTITPFQELMAKTNSLMDRCASLEKENLDVTTRLRTATSQVVIQLKRVEELTEALKETPMWKLHKKTENKNKQINEYKKRLKAAGIDHTYP